MNKNNIILLIMLAVLVIGFYRYYMTNLSESNFKEKNAYCAELGIGLREANDTQNCYCFYLTTTDIPKEMQGKTNLRCACDCKANSTIFRVALLTEI